MISVERVLVAFVVTLVGGCTSGAKDDGNMYGVHCDSKSEPVAECALYCEELCRALPACGQSSTSCLADCRARRTCEGETPDQGTSICKSARARIADAGCEAVCNQPEEPFVKCARDAGEGGS